MTRFRGGRVGFLLLLVFVTLSHPKSQKKHHPASINYKTNRGQKPRPRPTRTTPGISLAAPRSAPATGVIPSAAIASAIAPDPRSPDRPAGDHQRKNGELMAWSSWSRRDVEFTTAVSKLGDLESPTPGMGDIPSQMLIQTPTEKYAVIQGASLLHTSMSCVTSAHPSRR